MNLSIFLQAIISLVFIYLILSLLTSELQEYLATFSEARAKRLKQSIRQMLGEEDWLNGYFIDGKNTKVYSQDNVIPEKSMVWLNNEEPIQTKKVAFDENDDSPKFIWIDNISNNEDLTEDEVIVSPSDPKKAGKKNDANLTRFEVYKVGADITSSSDFYAWEKDGILTPVQDKNKLVNEGDTKFIWINVDQEVAPNLDPASQEGEKLSVYKSANQIEIKKDAKVWKQNTNIAEVLSSSVFLDSTSTSNQKFVWIDTNNQPIDLSQFNVVSYKTDPPTDPEKGAKIDTNLKKCHLYPVLVELKKDTKYYINSKNHRILLPPNSLTEELYKHPNIEALNQSAFRWFWILGISFNYPFKPWKDFKTLKDFNIFSTKFWKDFNKEDYFNLLSTALLIISVSCLFFSQILFAFIFFIFFAISRLWSLFSKGEKGKVGSRRESLGPSYIDDSKLFAETLIDVIYRNSSNIDDKNGNEGLKKTVNSLKFYTPASSRLVERLEKSTDITDLTTFTEDLQKQYEEVQKRSTGVYKRNAKGLSFVVGLLIAISFNADSFNMISNLTKENNNFSNQLISNLEKAPTLWQCPPGTPKNQSCLDETKQNQLKSLIDNTGTFPLGWDYDEKLNLQEQEQKIQNNYNLIQKLEGGDERTIYNYCVQDDIENIKHQDCFDKVEKVLIDNNNTDILPYLSPEFKSNIKEGVKNAKYIYSFPKTYRVFINEKKKELASLLVDKKLNTVPNTISIEQIKNTVDNTVQKQGGWFKVPFGWLITAIALSMGSPFWFDQLDRIMNVRNSAKPKDKGQNENT